MNLEEARRLTIQKQTGTELDIAPKIGGGWNRGTLQAGYKEDADSWLRNWRTERGLPADSGVIPSNRDEVPPYLRGWIFPKADASEQNGMMIAKLPHTPPTEKMLVGNRLMDSPLRLKSEEQRAQELEDYSKNFIYRGN